MDDERDEVVTEFDQTNGKAPGLEGDADSADDENRNGLDNIVTEAVDSVFGDDDSDRDRNR